MVETYDTVVTALVTLMGLIAGVNIITFRTVRKEMRPRGMPMVSVLLPARNEEKNIGLCLASLSDQDYPHYEIIVLDDNSEDRTREIIGEWTHRSRRVKLIAGANLPAGWVGKNFACHQLSQAAQGDLLLFVDADTVHSGRTISAAVAEMERSGADLLTMIPQQIMRGFWERLLLPLLYFSSLCFLPLPLVSATRNPKFAMANGQFMLFKRKVYEEIGGHKAVRDAMVEDVWLSRLVKKTGHVLRIVDGREILSCRMYTSLAEIWEGFSKNLFPGFKYSLGMLVGVVLFNLVTSVIPFALLLVRPFPEVLLSHVGLQVAALLGVRVALALRFRMSLAYAVLHPVAMLLMIGIALNSCRLVLFGSGSRWKGRSYDFRNTTIYQQ